MSKNINLSSSLFHKGMPTFFMLLGIPGCGKSTIAGEIAKSSWRLFSIKDDVYCTYESTSKFDAPEYFAEIKASEFCKIMEDNNIEL